MKPFQFVQFALFFLVLASLSLAVGATDYYKILGVPKNANDDLLKKSYRKLSKKYHPDKNQGDEEAAKKFVEIASAYETLIDKEKRRVYDSQGVEGVKKMGQQQSNPFDLFSQFGFGFGGNRQQNGEVPRGPSVTLDLPVTLEDIYNGKDVEIAIRNQVLCPKCRGSGAENDDDVTTCPHCKGKGHTIERQQIAPGFVQQFQSQCNKCGGKGKIVKSTCSRCKAKKVVYGEKTLDLSVERGMPDGAAIEFEGAADEHPDHQAGDIIFRVSTLPHPVFTRQMNDLHTTMKITLLEALVGFTKSITHLDEHEVEVQSASITSPGQIRKIQGEGMPHHNYASQKGDLYVKFEIIFPTSLTQEQQEGFSKLF